MLRGFSLLLHGGGKATLTGSSGAGKAAALLYALGLAALDDRKPALARTDGFVL